MIQGVPKKLGGFIWAPFVAFNDQNRFSHRFFTFLKQPGNELERSHCHLKSQKYIEDCIYISVHVVLHRRYISVSSRESWSVRYNVLPLL